MKKLLLLLSIFVFSSCGDLLLKEELISERKAVPGIHHNLYVLGQFSDQLVIAHNRTTYIDINPLGRCEEPLKTEQNFYISDFEGNFQPYSTEEGYAYGNWAFNEIKGKKIAYNRFSNSVSDKATFRYQVLSPSMEVISDHSIPLSEYIPDGLSVYHPFEVYTSDLNDFKVLASLSDGDELQYYQMEISNGQVKSFVLSDSHAQDNRWIYSELFPIGENYYFMRSEYPNTGKTVFCYSLDFKTGKIEKRTSIKITAGGATDLFLYEESPAFLALINNKNKIVKFDEQLNDFKIDEINIGKNLDFQSLRKVGAEKQTPIFEFNLDNGDWHVGVLENQRIVDYGAITFGSHQYHLRPNKELLAIENRSFKEDKSQVWLHHLLPNANKVSKLLYEGVGYRRSCLWWD